MKINFQRKFWTPSLLISYCILFFLIRFNSIYREAAGYDFSDSNSYFIINFSDPVRMPLIAAIFSTLYYFGAINIFQVLVSSFAWIFLGISIFLYLKKFKLAGFILVLSLGLTTPVVELDTLILSESLTVSFLVLSIASLLLYLKYRSLPYALLHLLFMAFFSQMKQSSFYLALLWFFIFISMVYIENNNFKKNIKYSLYFAPFFLLYIFTMNIVGENSLHNRQLSSTLIIEKSFFSDELREYWFSQGFPPEAFLVYGSKPTDIPIHMVRNLSSIRAWEMSTETNPSYRLLFDVPSFIFIAPILPRLYIDNYGYVNSIFPSLASGTNYVRNQDFRDGRYPGEKRDWISNWKLSSLFWWSNDFHLQRIILISIFLNFILFSTLTLLYLKDRVKYLESSYLVIFINWLLLGVWANWLNAPYRYERYLAPSAIGLRVLFIVVLMINISLVLDIIKRTRSKNSAH